MLQERPETGIAEFWYRIAIHNRRQLLFECPFLIIGETFGTQSQRRRHRTHNENDRMYRQRGGCS